MTPLHIGRGLVAALLAAPCAAFVVPAGPAQRVLHGASRSPVISSTPLDARRIAAGSRATRLAFSPLGPVDGSATAGGVGLGSPRRGNAPGALKAISEADGGDLEGGGKDLTAVRRALFLAIWLPFTIYAFGPYSPGLTFDPKDAELAAQLFTVPFTASPPETAVFSCIFSALAFLPAVVASVLIGGGAFGKGRQPVPPQPFVFGAFALGFFSVGPYLALRNYLPRAVMEEGEEPSLAEKALTSKFFAAPVLALAATTSFCLVSALTNPQAVSSFSELFWSSKFAHISTLDFLVLSATIVDPIREDMRRRGVEPETAKVALYTVPLVGPALWLLVRPPAE